MTIVNQSLDQHCSNMPDQIAVRCGSQDVSYADLDRRSNDIAAALKAKGVSEGDQVGICMGRSADLVAGILAILSLGAAFVPLDPEFPVTRLTHIVEKTNLVCVLTDDAAPHLPAPCLEAANVAEGAAAVGKTTVSDDQLAYIMHTSGSTGEPKGVKVSVGNLENLLRSMQSQFRLNENDRLLAVTTIAFDISVLELLLPLIAGGRIVIARSHQTRDGQALSELIGRENITVMQATPATWQMMLVNRWPGQSNLLALCGGEPMPLTLARTLAPLVRALWNMYGPTETTIWSTCAQITDAEDVISVGQPIENTSLLVVDDDLTPVPKGEQGELLIGGAGVCLGYTDVCLNEARFVEISQPDGTQQSFYRTGDLARVAPDGNLLLQGRIDDQIKVRGYRIELDDVSDGLSQISGVIAAKAICLPTEDGGKTIIGFCSHSGSLTEAHIKSGAAQILPHYMIPDRIFYCQEMPLSPNGKVDKAALRDIARKQLHKTADRPSQDDLNDIVMGHVARLTQNATIDATSNVFDAGLTSLQANILAARLSDALDQHVAVATIFEHPTLDDLIAQLGDMPDAMQGSARSRAPAQAKGREPIAIVGMALRVPGADTADAFWDIIKTGRDTVTRFDVVEDDPLVPEHLRTDPNYVRARGMLPNPDRFDAAFFGISPNDARVMDPQQRVFLELAWHALEDAGCPQGADAGIVSVYAGMGNNFYYHHNVATNPDFVRMVGEVQTEIGREKDHIATLVSHKLDLTGPSISVHTACSTGLVAIDQACHSLLSGQSDMALAGAIELCTPQMSGQIGEPAGIFTEDGACRPFSADATGTMFSDGAGIIVLKRLSDAQRDGDRIIASLIGTAVNHDGAQKKSYLAPSSKAQGNVMKLAQSRAGVAPGSIGYVEAHGTATPVGDPIEFTGLCDAFEGANQGSCALGSVKANLGHPTTAAGVVGVIKAALCLQQRFRPPLANFTGGVNPQIDLDNSPFYIPTTAEPWEAGPTPRRAAVSSFGFCGTNAHAILEEAPVNDVPQRPVRQAEVFICSAKTQTAASATAAQFAHTVASDQQPAASYTSATRRTQLAWRCYATEIESFYRPIKAAETAPVLAFVFPGQGTQYAGMGLQLAEQEADIARSLANISDAMAPYLGRDIRAVLNDPALLSQTLYTQPALFAVEMAMAKRMETLGLTPDILIGHSMGEFAAAVVAGVMKLHDAARMVCLRAKLMNEQTRGSMIATRLSEADLAPFLSVDLECAVLNGPRATIAGGSSEQIASLQAKLEAAGHHSVVLPTSHAFHTSAMYAAASTFETAMASISLKPPSIPIISTMTGERLTTKQAQCPQYWADQICKPVRYGDAIETLWSTSNCTLLEVGPGQGLSRMAASMRRSPENQNTVAIMHATTEDSENECHSMAAALGKLWAIGHEIDWQAYFAGRCQNHISLPSYVFDHQSFWLEPGTTTVFPAQSEKPQESQGQTEVEDFEAATIVDDLRLIFGSACGRDFAQVSETASFFDEGLDSLLLTQIIFMISECYGVTVTFRDLSRTLNTLESLAEFIAKQIGHEDDDLKESAEEELSTVPLSKRQQAILADAHDRLVHVGATLTLRGNVDHPRLEKAIQDLAMAHPALRATITKDGHALQISGSPLTPSKSATPAPGQPLWQLSTTRTSSGVDLKFGLHALIGDGWGLDVLIEDLAKLYRGDTLAPAEGLNSSAVTDLAFFGPVLLEAQSETARHTFAKIGADALAVAHDLARRNGCTPFVGWLTQVFLEMRSHSPDGDIGLYIASAMQPRLNKPRLIANCVDYIPLAQCPPTDIEFPQLSAALKLALIDASEASAIPNAPRPIQFDLGGRPLVGEFVHITRLTPAQYQFGRLESAYDLDPPQVLRADFRITLIEDTDAAELVLSRKHSLVANGRLDAFFSKVIGRFAQDASPENLEVSHLI
jgi:amino acid adenylation domain-containing protein